jgi:parallel beta-helix repeat protein
MTTRRFLYLPIITLVLFFQQNLHAATVYIDVTTTNATGPGSFDAAVLAATGGTAANPIVIRFSSLPGAGPWTLLQVGFQGDELLNQPYVTIDGTTAPGYSCVTGPRVKIVCDGSVVGGVTSGSGGLWIHGTSNNCMLKGIIVIGAIRVSSPACQVLGCYVNVEFGGTAAVACNYGTSSVLRVDGASTINCIIGGLNDCDRNLLNAGLGGGVFGRAVYVVGAGAGNKILGNYCGVDINGLNAIGNYFPTGGIIVVDGGNNTTVEGNVLSNGITGIWLDGTSTTCTIKDNMIGADKTGLFKATFAIGQNPIMLRSNHDNTIITGNVSGNLTSTSGGFATGVNICLYVGNDNVQITNNWVGVDKFYNKAGTPWCGIFTRGNATIISGNIIGDNGILNATQTSHGIGTDGATGCIITNNWVGVTPTGLDIGNGDTGIELNGGGGGHTVSGNVIGFNKSLRAVGNGGIGIWNNTASNIIDNNYIGVTPSGQNVGNLGYGVTSDNPNQTISNNRIAFNVRDGINLFAGADNIYITNNCMWCNGSGAFAGTARGIKFNSANNSYAESYTIPVAGTLTEVRINPIGIGATNTDTTGAVNWIVRGYSPANAAIEVFILDDCHLCTANGSVGNYLNEGQTMVGTATADANGFWSVSLPKADIGRGLVATATGTGSGSGVNKRTSEFSNPICFNNPCIFPKAVSLSTSPTPPTDLCPNTSLSLTGGYTPPLASACAIQYYYYSWYNGATLLAGPTLFPSPTTSNVYTIPSLALSDAGTYTFKVEAGTATAVVGCAKTTSVAVTVVVCPPLPVEWLSFYGLNSGNVNKLFWSTARESGNDYFELERSDDGQTFEMIGIISSLGNNGTLYNYEDKDVAKGTTYYYRIKQVDIDKNSSYSKNIAITSNGGLAVEFFPNPAANSATLTLTSEEDSQYQLLLQDLFGRTMTSGMIRASKGMSHTQLDFGDLASGMYVLTIQDSSHNVAIIKLAIQK